MPRTSDAKARLLEAALALIWRQSYRCVSVDDICERAGVRKGSFYHFFKSKSELAMAALESQFAEHRVQLDRIFSPLKPPLDRLQEFFASTRSSQETAKRQLGCVLGCPLATLGAEMCNQDPQIARKVQELCENYLVYLEAAVRDANAQGLIHAPEPRRKAIELLALYQGALTLARITNSFDALERVDSVAMTLLGAHQSPAATG